MRRHVTIVAVAFAASLSIAPAPASAAPATVTLGSAEVDLTPADDGGGTAKITLTNLTDDTDIVVAARAKTAPSNECEVRLDQDGMLPRAQSRTFKVTLTAGCQHIDDSFGIIVKAGEKDLPVVTAKVEDKKKPDWGALNWFWQTTLAAGLLMLIVGGTWILYNGVKNPLEPLPSLEDSWSFKDSWVSNVTVVGGLLAGVFGSSSVVKAMLGEDADEAVALATIGGAVSVALIGAAGVLVIALKTPTGGHFTVLGVLAGTALALGGAGGQLGVAWESASELDLGGVEDGLVKYLVASLVLLVVYGVTSVLGVLIQGHEKAADRSASETVFAAAVLATALRHGEFARREQVDTLLERLKQRPEVKDEEAAPKAEGKASKRERQTSKRVRRLMTGPVSSRSRRSALP